MEFAITGVDFARALDLWTVVPRLPADKVAEAKALHDAGRLQEAWQTLADAGDDYSDNAAQILDGDPAHVSSGPIDFRSMVEASWRDAGADISKFNDVARDHQSQYLEYPIDNDGEVPKTDVIEGFYTKACEQNGQPVLGAIDNSISSPLWASMLLMAPSRWSAKKDDGIDWQTKMTHVVTTWALGTFIQMAKQTGNSIGVAYSEAAMLNSARGQVGAPSSIPTRRDPLILDLDNNGIATTDASTNGLHFDHDANGFAEATGWLNPDDAFLAVDRNGNGQIDTGNELFGDQTTLRSGAKASSGLQALAEWDSNRDGRIDATDTRFNDLRAWTDTNQDGISQTNELQSMTDAGIASISLAGTATNVPADANGNTVTRSGSFTHTNGSTGLAGEIAFKRDTALTIPTASYTVTDSIAAQPDLSGYGNLLDLHQALAKEVGAGGTALSTALATYLAAPETTVRDTALDQLLYTWANATGVAPTSRGSAMDARQIAFLEAAFGQTLGNPDSNAATQWRMSWQQVREYYGASLLAQTTLKPLFDQIQYAWDDASQTLKADLTAVETLLQDALAADAAAGRTQLADFARAIKGLGAEDSVNFLALRETFLEQDQQNGTELAWAMDSAGMKVYDRLHTGQRTWSPHIEGTDGSEAVRGSLTEGDGYINSLYGHDTLWGTTRNETLINEAGDSLLYGAAGADNLLAGAGDDTLDGGSGNDLLQGEAGNDTYVFRRGSGVDRLRGWNAGDKVWLAANPDQIALKRSRNDLIIGFTDATDKLVIENYYLVGPNAGTVIGFRDGSAWNAADLDAWLANPELVGSGRDVVIGGSADETLPGYGGDDQIAGNEGNDLIEGGTGNDIIYGAASYDAYNDRLTAVSRANGDDTYVFRRGDGQDVIIDLDPSPNQDALQEVPLGDSLKLIGITPDEVTVSVANQRWAVDGGTSAYVADLVIDLGQGDQITLTQALSRSGRASGAIERIEFDPASAGSGQASADSGPAGTVWRNKSWWWRDGKNSAEQGELKGSRVAANNAMFEIRRAI